MRLILQAALTIPGVLVLLGARRRARLPTRNVAASEWRVRA
jgi:hypothetical protein